MKLTFDEAAVMVWLPKGEQPSPDHFKSDADLQPPSPNPEAWWELGDALIDTRTVVRDHGKEPWIKVGSTVLTPSQVIQAYEAFKNGKDFHA